MELTPHPFATNVHRMKLKEYIDYEDTNVAKLSKEAGIDPKTVWRFLNDGAELKVSTAKKISAATDFRVTVYELLNLPPLVITKEAISDETTDTGCEESLVSFK